MYTDYARTAEGLTDKRFKIVEDPREAKILWITQEYEKKVYEQWGIDEANTFVNYFKKEAALVSKAHLANLINTTLSDKSCIMESYDLELHLPNFIGSFLER